MRLGYAGTSATERRHFSDVIDGDAPRCVPVPVPGQIPLPDASLFAGGPSRAEANCAPYCTGKNVAPRPPLALADLHRHPIFGLGEGQPSRAKNSSYCQLQTKRITACYCYLALSVCYLPVNLLTC